MFCETAICFMFLVSNYIMHYPTRHNQGQKCSSQHISAWQTNQCNQWSYSLPSLHKFCTAVQLVQMSCHLTWSVQQQGKSLPGVIRKKNFMKNAQIMAYHKDDSVLVLARKDNRNVLILSTWHNNQNQREEWLKLMRKNKQFSSVSSEIITKTRKGCML